MAQTYFSVDTGSTINLATYVFSEGSTTVYVASSVLNSSLGVELGNNANPLVVSVSGGTVSVTNSVSITGSVSVLSTPAVTGSVSVVNTPSITGSVSVLSMPTVTVTGSTTIASMPSITGSVSILSQPAITGSVTVIGTVTITGSTSVLSLPSVTGSVSLVVAPSFGSQSINVSTAGTSIIIPSTATNSIYLTSLFVMNGNTAGTIYLGQGTSATAPTGTAILIQPLYFAANCGVVYPIPQQTPIKLPASSNFICTVNSSGSLSVTATYYVAP